LRAHRSAAPLVLGGIVPEAHREALLAVGVARIVGPDTPLDRIVLDVLRVLSPQAQPSPC
jgi:methylmalonyl-CoA mutase